METTNIENYVNTSKAIEQSKDEIVSALAGLHEDLCNLARLERDLESERVKGVKKERGLSFNDPALIEHLEEHNKQLQVPVQKVWVLVNDVITAIYQTNQSAMNGSVNQLPDVFKRTNRFEDFTKGIG